MKRAAFLVALLAVLCLATSAGAMTVELDRTHVLTGIGKKFAFTTTVRVVPPNQPAPFPIANATPPPRTAATRVTTASCPARIASL